MADCCYSGNCSILIPRMIYTSGDLAAAIVVTAFLVGGISVAIHVSAFYWIYKKKLQPQMVKTDKSARQRRNSMTATGEGIAADVEQMTYEFVSDDKDAATGASNKSAKPLPAPRIKQNLAYDNVRLSEAEQNWTLQNNIIVAAKPYASAVTVIVNCS